MQDSLRSGTDGLVSDPFDKLRGRGQQFPLADPSAKADALRLALPMPVGPYGKLRARCQKVPLAERSVALSLSKGRWLCLPVGYAMAIGW
jgi:hypothetical protein